MTENKDRPPGDHADAAPQANLDDVGRVVRSLRAEHRIPDGRKPRILICGKIGSGKSTTINTLFGQQVTDVGHFSRGTDKDELYEWEAAGENVDVVDLPGLGDSKRSDKLFAEMYRRHIPNSDGFIIIVNPPRPAEEGTLRTANLLISSGVSSKHIIFGYNKLSHITYPGPSGRLAHVEMDGLIGPTEQNHRAAIELAKEAFLRDLNKEMPKARFAAEQIVEFDSLSGWNLHRVLLGVIKILPFESLARLDRARAEAERAARKREEARLHEEQVQIDKRKHALREVETRIHARDTQLVTLETQLRTENTLRLEQEARLREQQLRVQEQETALREREASAKQHEARLREEEARHREAQARVREEEARRREDDARRREEELRRRENEEAERLREDLAERQKRATRRRRAIHEFGESGEEVERTVVERIVDGIAAATNVVLKVGRAILKFFSGW